MKRNVLVGVRFSPEEHAYLCEQAEKDVETQKRNGTKNLSAYIRKRVLERSGYQEEIQIQKSLKELTYQFRKIGTNINQATKQLHIGYEPISSTNLAKNYVSGMYELNSKTKIYVNTGIGTTHVSGRLGVVPEISIFHIYL